MKIHPNQNQNQNPTDINTIPIQDEEGMTYSCGRTRTSRGTSSRDGSKGCRAGRNRSTRGLSTVCSTEGDNFVLDGVTTCLGGAVADGITEVDILAEAGGIICGAIEAIVGAEDIVDAHLLGKMSALLMQIEEQEGGQRRPRRRMGAHVDSQLRSDMSMQCRLSSSQDSRSFIMTSSKETTSDEAD
jgi:hypothetical protein